MLNKEKIFILAVRCKTQKNLVKGSIKEKCCICNEECWISPSSQNVLYDANGIICEICIMKEEVNDKIHNNQNRIAM